VDQRRWPRGVPAPLTPLVGRKHEVAEVARLVGEHRLVTLTGAGGVGKTRLAFEVAARVAAFFADGSHLVDLSAVSGPAGLTGAVAAALGVEDRPGAGLAGRLAAVLRPQRRLVVLDNCEHLRASCAALVAGLLSSCPELTILSTSRENLSLPGEVTWRVPSLRCPGQTRQMSPRDIEGFDAAALFLARARAARPGLEVQAGDVGPVAAICQRLDGIPLALELAAALAGAMGLDEIAERLSGRLELLAPPGGWPVRHQTLRASIEWSYQLLGEAERALFRRLSVFCGGWSLDSAEAVCCGDPVPEREVAPLLAALVSKSLVQAEWPGPGTRYRMLETIREFARELLASSAEIEHLAAAHATHFTQLAERTSAKLAGPDQVPWARRLDADLENLRAARTWCDADAVRAGTGLRMAAGLWEYWHIRGSMKDGTEWLTSALRKADQPLAARAAALNGLGVLLSLSGEIHRGGDYFAESIAAYEQWGDQRGLSHAWTHLGNSRAIRGDRAGSDEAFARGLALAEQAGSRWHEAFSWYLSGTAALIWGDAAKARARLEKSSRMFADLGDRRAVGYSLVVLGSSLVMAGDQKRALDPLREGMKIFEIVTERWGLLCAVAWLADATAAASDWRRTALLLGVADSLSERISARLLPYMQAAAEALSASASAHLGQAAESWYAQGRAIGRSDAIATALWPDRNGPPGPGASQRPVLTRREEQVAGLIAEGLTNRQIGERLFIGQRTVDSHVSHIFAKLGCTTRAQVAAIITARPAESAGPAE